MFLLPASWRNLLADQVLTGVVKRPLDWVDVINQQPTNLAFMLKAVQNLRDECAFNTGIQDEADDLFANNLIPNGNDYRAGIYSCVQVSFII